MSLLVWLPLNNSLQNQGLGNPTVASGTATYNTGKLANKALNLNSRVVFDCPELTGLKTWSVSFWGLVNDDTNLSGDWKDLLGLQDQKSDNTTNGEFRWEACWGSSKGVGIGQYNNGTYATMTTNGGTLIGTKGQWHHLVAVVDYENSLVTIYTDNNVSYTKVHAGGHLTGRFWLGETNVMNGSIQDVRIYDHALSKREVKELSKGLMVHLPLSWGANPNLTVLSRTLNNSSGNNGNFTHETVYYDNYPVRKFTCKTDNYTGGPWGSGFTKNTQAVVGTQYTWSMYIRGSGDFTMTSVGHECGGTRSVTVSKEWQKFTHTWTLTDGSYTAWVFYGKKWALGEWIEVKDLKVEEGPIATTYIPNANEAEYSTYAYNSIFKTECAGLGNNISTYGNTFTPCTSPKNINGTAFGANSCIILGTAPKVRYPFSFAFWFNTTDLAYANNRLISCTEGGGWNVEGNGSGISWTVGTGASSNTYKTCVSTTTAANLVNGWHHIACIYDGLKSQMYIDGVLDKEVTHFTTATPAYYHGSNSVFLGAEAGANATPQTYNIVNNFSDFRFYATALSASDVKALYNVSAEIDKSGKLYCGTLVEV